MTEIGKGLHEVSILRRTVGAGLGVMMVFGPAVVAAQNVLEASTALPPNAKPGQCWVKAIIPPQYSEQTVEIVKAQASEKIEIVPASYRTEEQRLLIKEASVSREVVPAVYENVKERVLVEPAYRVWKMRNDKAAPPSLVQAAGALGVPLSTAKPGQCFAEYYVPPTYKSETVQVVVKEASETIEVVPARYEIVEQKVLVADGTQELEVVPAKFETVKEKILVAEAAAVWKKGRGPVERIDDTTGEIMCLVNVPAKYATIEKQVLKAAASVKTAAVGPKYETRKIKKLVEPGSVKRTAIPAESAEIQRRVRTSDGVVRWFAVDDAAATGEPTGNRLCADEMPAKYTTVTKRIVKTPASVKEVPLPAEYVTVKVRKLVSEPQQRKIQVPEVRETITKRVKTADESLQWRQVLCDTNMTPDVVKEIQRALMKAGFNPGPIDGAYGRSTVMAAERFQQSKGLPRGGLTMDTLTALGLQLGTN